MHHPPIDPAWIAAVVREVIERLSSSDSMVTEKVISVRTIEKAFANTRKEIAVGPNAIITPAARDEAKRLGVTIRKAGQITKQTQPTSIAITDRKNPERAIMITEQLKRRGIKGQATIVLSEKPSSEVFRLISETKQRVAMVSSVSSVDRIKKELSPEVWVIDMNEVNLIAAVNIAARIA